eukprot:scaffold1_cov375-Pavlova_lutheri.AAC.5
MDASKDCNRPRLLSNKYKEIDENSKSCRLARQAFEAVWKLSGGPACLHCNVQDPVPVANVHQAQCKNTRLPNSRTNGAHLAFSYNGKSMTLCYPTPSFTQCISRASCQKAELNLHVAFR